MEFNEIVDKFEHKRYLTRSDFIDEYNFSDDFFDYYKNFIELNILKVKKGLYLSDLIDLSSYLELFDDDVFEKIASLLFEKRALVAKLSAILYLEDSFDEGKSDRVLEIYDGVLKSKMPILLRNQVLISLIQLDIPNKLEKFDALILSLKKTNDVMSIYRILNLINDIKISDEEKNAIIQEIANLHKKKDFGKDITNLLALYTT